MKYCDYNLILFNYFDFNDDLFFNNVLLNYRKLINSDNT